MLVAVCLADDTCLHFIVELESSQEAAVKRFLGWMKGAFVPSPNWDIPSAGAVAIGNIARNPEQATTMGGNVDVLDCLVSMLSTDNSGFQYSALGVLKNLSVAPPNKKRLLQGTVIAGLHTTLKSPQEPLQYLSASTLRAICIDQDADSVRQLAEYPGMIARLTHLGKQEQEAVRFEALRTIANIVRFGRYIPPETEFIPSLVAMAAAEHATLVSDAIVTLVRLSVDQTVRKAIAEANALEACINIVKSSTRAHEAAIVCNASSLIAGLLGDPSLHTTEEREAARQAVTCLQSHEQPHVVEHVSKILASLRVT